MNQSKTCARCGEEKSLSEFRKHATGKFGVTSRCKECCSALDRLDRLEDPEKYRQRWQRYKILNWNARRESDRKSKKRCSARVNTESSNRRAKKLDAFVPWANRTLIKQMYTQAIELEKQTGTKHHVDHVIPLINESVCGLHCEFNLRVIPWFENLKKSNKYQVE